MGLTIYCVARVRIRVWALTAPIISRFHSTIKDTWGTVKQKKETFMEPFWEEQKGPVISPCQTYLQGANMRFKFKQRARACLTVPVEASPSTITISVPIPKETDLANQHCVKSFLFRYAPPLASTRLPGFSFLQQTHGKILISWSSVSIVQQPKGRAQMSLQNIFIPIRTVLFTLKKFLHFS